MMHKIICDKCGEEIKTSYYIQISFHETNGFVTEQSYLDCDLCNDCADKLIEFLNTKEKLV